MVICLVRGADLHISQLMPLPLTVSCFSKMQIGFTFLVPAHLGGPGKRAVKRVCVCVCVNGRWCCVVDDCSGGVMLTVRGDNLDVVHKSRMVVTVTIREDDDEDDTGSDERPDRKDAEQLEKTYESVVCVSCISDMELGHWVTRSGGRQ